MTSCMTPIWWHASKLNRRGNNGAVTYQLKADMIPTAAHVGVPRKKGRIWTFDAVDKPEGVQILGFLLIIRKQQYTRVTFWCQNRCTLSPSGDAYPEILA